MADSRLLPLTVSDRLWLLPTMCRMIWSQILLKRGADVRAHGGAELPAVSRARSPIVTRFLRRGMNLLALLRRMFAWNSSQLQQCCHVLRLVRAEGHAEVVVYGEGRAAEMILRCAPLAGIRVAGVCPWGLPESRVPPSLLQWSESALADWTGPIVVAACVNSERHVNRLLLLGVRRSQMIVLE